MNAHLFRFLINRYPPYWGTGITVTHISPDYREVRVQMKMRWYNRNYVRTHFGGSLYAMTDPFYMLMLIHILGDDYTVWDKEAAIDFIKPARGTVTAAFHITDEHITAIRNATHDGGKYLPRFPVDITDEGGHIVARVIKTVYIRRKKRRE